MYELIELIKKFFGLTGKLNPIRNTFYFTPQLFYKRTDENFIKIGIYNDEDVFEMHYYLEIDLYKTNLISLVYEFKSSKSVQDFFKSKNIDIDKKEIHELIDYRHVKIGKIINFIFKTNNSSNFPEQNKIKTNINLSNIHKEKISFEQHNNNDNGNNNQFK